MAIDVTLRAAHRREPLGIPAESGVMLSWAFEGDGSAVDTTRGVDVEAARDEAALETGDLLWSAEGLPGFSVRYGGPAPASRERVVWRVTARDVDGGVLTSGAASFEVGLERESDWSADWISAPLDPLRREQWEPVAQLRRALRLDDRPRTARVHATALGVYRLWVNGEEATARSLFRPGWTDYRLRVLHQTFDVGPLLRAGENVVAVELSKGWYAGFLGLQREPGFYGDQPALRLQLEGDGEVLAASGADWRWATGDIIASDMLRGETRDLRQATPGWRSPGFDDASWGAALVRADVRVPVTPQPHDPVAPCAEFAGELVRAHARGPAVFDFGRNMVGWTRVETRTHPKADVIVRHAERLGPDDLTWREPLRSAFQEDRYTTGDGERHVLEPRHTLHGFQFAEVWGLVPEVEFDALVVPEDFAITGVAVGGGQRPAGSFACSDDLLTQVSSMVEWTVRDNFIEVITDCPQRDERLGWLGDAGVISTTASYYFDLAAFLAKFTRDASDSQTAEGMIRSYVPPVPPGTSRDGAPGWADGYVRLVHLAATRYGDLVTAEAEADAIGRFLEFVDGANPSGIRTERVGSDFSDWLSLPEDPDEPPHPGYAYTGSRSTSSKRVVATAHTIRSMDQYAEVLGLLGRDAEAERWRLRADQIREAYTSAFVDERGWIEGDTQTVYAQAIGYDVVRGELRDRVARRLAEKIEETGHATTGIHGVEHLLPALVSGGRADLAERLLLRGEMPSWKYMASMGAQTIWEKWDALRLDGTHSTAEMNSLNHCALGAVGEFLFERVAGLDARGVASTGAVVSRPVYLDGLEWARAEHDTVAGAVTSSWRRDGAAVVHELELAPAVRARFVVPDGWRLETGGDERELLLEPGPRQLRLVRA